MSPERDERRHAAAEDLADAGGHDAPIRIVRYRDDWPRQFVAEAERLRPFVPDLVFHHIGSTAVPGLAAKPVIDLMAFAEKPDMLVEEIIAAGYQYPRAYNAVLGARRWFCRPSAAVRTHHLHLVADRDELDRNLHIRDVLRTREDLADEYAALKRDLARSANADREGYTAGKTAFIGRIGNLTL
ncbi:GrpB family protein [Tomitella gaofuii]|uniref:GrpB family protein n=1 Tax=Tomitella gaofuii TaxID=2760083 RepID=UPI0015FB1C65|nr:GrpB family protein [Tomitella gaofuii]